MSIFEAPRQLEIPRLPAKPDPEYLQTAVVSFDGLAGRALARHMMEISLDIINGRTDQAGNDRLVAVLPMWDKATLKWVHRAGFRTAEIDNDRQLVGLELVPHDDRTRPVRVDIDHEIIQDI